MFAIGAALAVVMLAGFAQGNEFRALSVPEMAAAHGATHMARFTFSDLSNTNVDTAQAFTNFSAAAKQGVELVCMVLETPYDTGNTNYTGSVLLTVGDADDADRFLTSTELASDGTEVFMKFGRNDATASTLTKQTVTITRIATNLTLTPTYGDVVIGGLYTNNLATNWVLTTEYSAQVLAVTNTTAAAVVAQQLYTASTAITATFTPNSEEALASNSSGAVRLYWRVSDATKLDY